MCPLLIMAAILIIFIYWNTTRVCRTKTAERIEGGDSWFYIGDYHPDKTTFPNVIEGGDVYLQKRWNKYDGWVYYEDNEYNQWIRVKKDD